MSSNVAHFPVQGFELIN